MLVLCLMYLITYYALNYTGIISRSLQVKVKDIPGRDSTPHPINT